MLTCDATSHAQPYETTIRGKSADVAIVDESRHTGYTFSCCCTSIVSEGRRQEMMLRDLPSMCLRHRGLSRRST